jgi:hypothetical protein
MPSVAPPVGIVPPVYTVAAEHETANGLVAPAVETALVVGSEPGMDVGTDLASGLGGGALGAFLTTLIVGAILIAVVPEYTQSKMVAVAREPVPSLLYGLLALLALIVAIVVLVLTLIGVVVAIPLVIVATLVWSVGAVIGYLAIADRLIGHADGWLKPLLVASVINGGLALTGVGGLVSFAVGAAGFGAVLRGYLA